MKIKLEILVIAMVLFPLVSWGDFGGPDADDYVWIDSLESGGPTYSYLDITSTGTPFYFGDDTYSSITIPSFCYRGSNFTTLYVSSNGMIGFSPTGMTSPNNTSLPTAAAPNNIICLFWDDLKPEIGGDGYYKVDSPTIIVSYDGIPCYSGSFPLNLQAHLSSATDVVEIHYKDTYVGDPNYDYGASATVGCENFNGTVGLQVGYNQPVLQDNYAIAYFQHLDSSPGGFGLLQPADGAVDPALGDTIHFAWQSSILSPQYGRVHYFIEIASDADFNTVVYSANLTVTSTDVTYSWTRDQYYYWRVTAIDTWDYQRECNQPFSFYVCQVDVAPTSLGNIKARFEPGSK
jgi:hypothetical protein